MPELPDVDVYVERLATLFGGQVLCGLTIASPFVLRTVAPSAGAFEGTCLVDASRLGKRIVLEFESERFMVIHLMIAGRLRMKPADYALPKRQALLALRFPEQSVVLTEAGTKKRASLHLVEGRGGLASFDRGGLEPLECSAEEFSKRLTETNRTLKRALTDPSIFSGIGNAYSDEILYASQLSPVQRTQNLSPEEAERLFGATVSTLRAWRQRHRDAVGEGFPDTVTAFHEEMAVHGRYGKPCRNCGGRVQRIKFADNELNYCPQCQTGGKLLADRGLSRLLRGDWPKTLEELELIKQSGGASLGRAGHAASTAKCIPLKNRSGAR